MKQDQLREHRFAVCARRLRTPALKRRYAMANIRVDLSAERAFRGLAKASAVPPRSPLPRQAVGKWIRYE